jgi:hypothetical protein
VASPPGEPAVGSGQDWVVGPAAVGFIGPQPPVRFAVTVGWVQGGEHAARTNSRRVVGYTLLIHTPYIHDGRLYRLYRATVHSHFFTWAVFRSEIFGGKITVAHSLLFDKIYSTIN